MNIKTEFSKIIVTGPQRSGTRIVAKIIAYDNNIRYVDEIKIGNRITRRVDELLKQDERMVIQCPKLCSQIHKYSRPDLLVVMVIRDIKEIIKSQGRIKWTNSVNEKRELESYGKKNGIIAKIKYDHWKKQKEQIPNYLEIKYADLKDHPLFIPKEKRRNFTWNQTER